MLDFSVTFIITIINITVLFFVLRAVLWKPVTKFMEDRTRRVEESIEHSKEDRAQAKALLEQYQTQLKNAEAEAQTIIRNARDQAQKEADRIKTESQADAEQILENTRKQLFLERQAALSAFRKEAASLVMDAAGKLVGREISSQDNLLYAEMLLSEPASLQEPASFSKPGE